MVLNPILLVLIVNGLADLEIYTHQFTHFFSLGSKIQLFSLSYNSFQGLGIYLTKRLKEAGNFLNISVLDHIIITSEAYYSFADEGLL
jgi:hypothetical protein